MTKITVHKVAEWSGVGQFRTLLVFADHVFMVGGVYPISGPRSRFHAMAVSLDIQNAKLKWILDIDRSRPFEHGVVHGSRLIVTVPNNFTRSFTGYLVVDIANGLKESQCQLDEVIRGVASVDGKLLLGTALHGVYRVFSCENGEKTDFPWIGDSRFWLEGIIGVANDTLVVSKFDHTISNLIYIHSAFSIQRGCLWTIESSHKNVASVGNRTLIWGDESAATEVVDTKTGQRLAVLELTGSPLESPVAIGEYGLAYARPDCSIRLRSWDGEDREIFRQPTTGTIALAYDNKKNTLVAAFSGNYKEPNTKVSLFELDGI